jgi:hypothetical protein
VEATTYGLLVGGIGLLAVGVATGEVLVIRTAGVIAALGAVAFATTLGRVLRHLLTRPVPARRAATTFSAAS